MYLVRDSAGHGEIDIDSPECPAGLAAQLLCYQQGTPHALPSEEFRRRLAQTGVKLPTFHSTYGCHGNPYK